MRLFLRFAVVGLSLTAAPALAEVPLTMSYQGVLTDGSGNIPSDGPHNFTFAIYDTPTGGSLLWGPESHNGRQVTRGGFDAVLGQGSVPVPLTLPFDRQYYLEIAVDGGAPLVPRVPLTSSPYSLRAKLAEETFAHAGFSATVTIGTSWTTYGTITLNAPGPGYVVVDSGFWLLIDHTAGSDDIFYVGISNSPTPIDFSNQLLEGLWADEVAAAEGTNNRRATSGHVQYVFPVTGGPQTYYLLGKMITGQNSGDWFWYANMNAIYHYDPAPVSAATLSTAKKFPGLEAPAAATPSQVQR